MKLAEAIKVRELFVDKYHRNPKYFTKISAVYDVKTLKAYELEPGEGESADEFCLKVSLRKGNDPKKLGLPDEYKGLKIFYNEENFELQ